MRKHVLIWGMVGGALIVVLRLIEYRFLVLEHSFEIYAGIIAALFAAGGIWLGVRFAQRKKEIVVRTVTVGPEFVLDEAKRDGLRITARELEILALIAEGLSTREIAERVNVSENTVKTHSSRVFDKLGAKRRTQAVQLGKELRLIP